MKGLKNNIKKGEKKSQDEDKSTFFRNKDKKKGL